MSGSNQNFKALLAGQLNGLVLTPNATGASISGGVIPKSITWTNNLTLSGTDGATLNTGTGGTLASWAYTGGPVTITPTAGTNLNVATTTTGNFAVNTNQLVVVPGTGVCIGDTAPLTSMTVKETSTASPRGILSMQFSSDSSSARVGFAKARGTIAAPTTVVTGDILGRLLFRGYDGANFLEMGSIECKAVGTIGTGRVPTSFVISTATDAATSVLTTRMTIDQSGNIFLGDGGTTNYAQFDSLGNLTLHGSAALPSGTANTGIANTWTAQQRGSVGALTASSGNVAVDLSTCGGNFTITMPSAVTFLAPTNCALFDTISILITQGGSAYSAAFNAAFVFDAGTPTITAAGLYLLNGQVMAVSGTTATKMLCTMKGPY